MLTKTSTGQEALQGNIGNPGSGGEPDPAISAVELCITAVSGTLQLCVTAVSRRAARGPRGPSYGFTVSLWPFMAGSGWSAFFFVVPPRGGVVQGTAGPR